MTVLRIAYLHLGHDQHGVRRYGELLAGEARRQGEEVVEMAGDFNGLALGRGIWWLADAARKLSSADIVHCQYTPRLWGGPRKQVAALGAFLASCRCPSIITLHDVRSSSVIDDPLRITRTGNRVTKPSRLRPSRILSSGSASVAHHVLAWGASRLLLFSQEEIAKMGPPIDGKAEAIPHFVEERSLPVGAHEARQQLGLPPHTKLVSILGFIHPRKGYHVALESLAHLPPEANVRLAFIGRPALGNETYLESLLRRASDLGVRKRLMVTGYLPETQLDLYLAATDLALCPYRRIAASGSLATWISARVPIAATAQPYVRRFNEIEPGAIREFHPLTPEAVSEVIQEQLLRPLTSSRRALERLASKLSLSRVFQMHRSVYQRVLSSV